MTIRLIVVLLVSAGCTLPLSAEVSGCESSQLLHRYSVVGAADWRPDGDLVLDLSADLHAADCGVPDCFGTRIRLQLSLDRSGDRCRITDATLHTEGFAGRGCRELHLEESRFGKVSVEPEGSDLADPRLAEVIFREVPGGRALVVLPENFYYFERAALADDLRASLDPGNMIEDGCCWGASSAALRHFEAYEEASRDAEARIKE